MSHLQQVLALRSSLWADFAALVRRGADFPQLREVFYPVGAHAPGLGRCTDGRYWFYATRLLANPQYRLLEGEDLIVGAGRVVFLDTDGRRHELEPDILDLIWLAETLDEAQPEPLP